MRHLFGLALATTLLAAGCGGDEESCDPIARSGCDTGYVCEEVEDEEPACFRPVVLRGSVFDLFDDGAIAGARVVALDANRSAVGSVAITDESGEYEMDIPARRTSDGVPIGYDLTLRADAAGYQTFPSGIRQALPIDTSNPIEEETAWVVASALTDVGLLPMEAGSGTGSIHGTVEAPSDRRGMLVVAETSSGTGSAVGYSAIADRDGSYRIYNLPAASYTVTAYARDVNYDAVDVDLGDGDEAEVDLSLNDIEPGAVSGSVQIVNAPGGSMTTVILVVESTFDELLARGEVPPGLRAPEAGVPANIVGEYSFEGVPAGRYVVLAAFENDDLVRDPDTSIGGTSILHIEVSPGATTVVDGFKVTEALDVIGPGALGPEEVTGSPTLSWVDDSGEDRYHLEVFDAFGELVWEDAAIPKHTGDDPAIAYGGPALESGMYYQFRVTSYDGADVPLSRTEDLKGVFYLP